MAAAHPLYGYLTLCFLLHRLNLIIPRNLQSLSTPLAQFNYPVNFLSLTSGDVSVPSTTGRSSLCIEKLDTTASKEGKASTRTIATPAFETINIPTIYLI